MADEPEVQFGRWLVALKRAVQNPIRTLKRIGTMVTSRIQRRFTDQQAPDGSAWPGRMNPNIPGILSDLARGASIKARRFEDRPAVVDTGHVRQSIAYIVESLDTVKIGTALDYAKFHQFGLERVIPITKAMKDGLAQLLATFRRGSKRAAKRGQPPPGRDPSSLAFLLRRDEFKFKIIARPFIGISDQDQADIYDIVRENFLGDALRESTS